jgi:hypothetical protein
MSIISESYRKKLMSLAGLKSNTLQESSRIDFLKKDFSERVGRKYDKFLKFYSIGNWNPEKENDNFIKNIMWNEKLAFSKGKELIPKDRFVELMVSKFFAELEKSDPSENKQYLSWLINIFLSGNLPTEDIYKINEALTSFSKNKDKIPVEQRNINSFTDLPTLFAVISQYGESEEMSASEKDKLIKLEGAEQIYDSPSWKIIIPKTKDAACLYGKSTKWCTASESGNQFSYYSKQGPLYILIDKRITSDRDIFKKLQFHFESGQFMDTTDRRIDITKFFKANPEVKNFFKRIGKIDAAFEIEHMLVSKEEGLKLLKTTENKFSLIDRKGFSFLKKFYIEIGATKEFLEAILSDDSLIKGLFERELFGELIDSYKEMNVESSGLNVIKSLPWLNSWLSNPETKPEIIQKFIYSLCEKLGHEGKEFAKHLLKRGGVIWKALLKPGENKISHYFNMLSARQSLGAAGSKTAKEMLKDPSVLAELKANGITKTTIEMLNKFYSMFKESYQAEIYLRNILR